MDSMRIHHEGEQDGSAYRPPATVVMQQLFHSPLLPVCVRELQSRLQEEQAKRERLYGAVNGAMSEEQKVEFINGEVIVQSPGITRQRFETCSLY